MSSLFGHILNDLLALRKQYHLGMPRIPIEPPDINLVACNSESNALACRVCAPPAVACHTISLSELRLYALFDEPLKGSLVISDNGSMDREDIKAALDFVAAHAEVVAFKTCEAADFCSVEYATNDALAVLFTPHADRRCVEFAITATSERALQTPAVIVSRVSVAGVELSVGSVVLPLRIPVISGIIPPFCLVKAVNTSGNYSYTPAVGADGVIYVPAVESSILPKCGPLGDALAPLSLKDYGVSKMVVACAVHSSMNVILLGSADFTGAKVTAINERSGTVLWTAPLNRCIGVAIFEIGGVAMALATSHGSRRLHAFRLIDGVETASAETSSSPTYIAADSRSGMIYVRSDYGIAAYLYNPVRATLESRGVVHDSPGAITVMPPVVLGGDAVLICLTKGGSTMKVLSIPDHRILATHKLVGDAGSDWMVSGLAADPHGRALVVYDAKSRDVHVIAWPIPGMVWE